jgi:hypothetical protein
MALALGAHMARVAYGFAWVPWPVTGLVPRAAPQVVNVHAGRCVPCGGIHIVL